MVCLKVVEFIGCSNKSFEDAILEAVKEANKTLRNIRGAKVVGQNVVIENGRITGYRANIKIAYLRMK